jgi:hypothetical protein
MDAMASCDGELQESDAGEDDAEKRDEVGWLGK